MQLRTTRANYLTLLLSSTAVACLAAITLNERAECKGSGSNSTESQHRGLKKGAHDASLTGEYDFKPGRNESELYVKELEAGKIQFALKSLWIGNAATGNVHTGQGGGVVELKNKKGAFKNENFSLDFIFTPGHCAITCGNCSGFGGMNVDPNGTYKKVSAKVPTDADLETYQ